MDPDIEDYDDIAVKKFTEYLKIRTDHPSPHYAEAVDFLRKYAAELNLEFSEIELPSGNPVALMTVTGRNQDLPSVLLNSHMDVVPADVASWSCDPFEGIERNDKIYGRGSQDMKCVAVQYLEALRRSKNLESFIPDRNIYLSFVPDEEIGGKAGMGEFYKMEQFKKMNVGFAIDEGIPSPMSCYFAFKAERYPLWCKVTFTGFTGHGSLPASPDFAAEKFRRFLNSLMLLHDNVDDTELINLGEKLTINLTGVSGGIQTNIIPPKIDAIFDIRIPPSKLEEFMVQFTALIDDSNLNESISVQYLEYPCKSQVNNKKVVDYWFERISSCFQSQSLKSAIFPGTTDLRYLRSVGIPAVGLTLLNNTDILLHSDDECVNKNAFLDGIELYRKIIKNLSKA